VADYNYRTDYFVYVFYFGLSGAGLTAGQADFVSIEIEDDAYFDWEKTTALCQQIAATAMEYVYIAQQVGVQITDGGTGRDLFSQSSVLPVMSGSTLFPYELPIPHRFVPKTQCSAIFTNNLPAGGPAIQGWLAMHGRKTFLPDVRAPYDKYSHVWKGDDEVYYAEDSFTYILTIPALAAGATVVVKQTIEAESDFEWIEATIGASQNGAGNLTGFTVGLPLTILISDLGQNGDQYDQALNVGEAWSGGNNSGPFILPESHIFLGRSKIQATVTNTSNLFGVPTTYNSITIALAGRKIFRLQ
jgi:hypothetical protein